jgi:hypothetical protein
VAIHTEQSWKRHSNPWSVWTRILSYPLAYVPVWNRCWKQGALVGAWFTANPVIFPAPEDDSSWATRCVLGEQLWTAKRRAFLWHSTPPRLCSTQVRSLWPTSGDSGL